MTSSAIEIEARSMVRSSSREDPTGLRGPTSTSSWRSSSREDPPVGAHDGAHTDEGALDEDAHDDAEPSSIAISKQTAIRILREVREHVREQAMCTQRGGPPGIEQPSRRGTNACTARRMRDSHGASRSMPKFSRLETVEAKP